MKRLNILLLCIVSVGICFAGREVGEPVAPGEKKYKIFSWSSFVPGQIVVYNGRYARISFDQSLATHAGSSYINIETNKFSTIELVKKEALYSVH